MPYTLSKYATRLPRHGRAACRERARPYTQSERAFARLWQRADALSDGLVTEDGKRFRVVYPGRLNSRAGPDFHDAIIATDEGERISGDVEIHLNAPDWYRHRHDTDPNYNGVILHVVLRPKRGTATRQQSGTAAPVASLAGHVDQLGRADDAASLEPPEWESMDGESLGRLLDRAGDERFLARSRGFALELEDGDAEQTLYRAIMDALGYASNRKPFRELAKRAPISSLARFRGEPPATRLLTLKAWLVGASGLLSMVRPPEEEREMRRIRRGLPAVRAMSPTQWKLFRVRPANHPLVRITGAARLVDRFIEQGLARGLESEVERGDATWLTSRIVARPHVAASRARDIAVNVVLPFLHAYKGIGRSPQSQGRYLELYHAFPKLAENEITREMTRLLPPDARKAAIRGARRQQGLIHLYKLYKKAPTDRFPVQGPPNSLALR